MTILLIEFPAVAPEKAMADDTSSEATATQMRNLDGMFDSCLQSEAHPVIVALWIPPSATLILK